jgi:hypothetical protein
VAANGTATSATNRHKKGAVSSDEKMNDMYFNSDVYGNILPCCGAVVYVIALRPLGIYKKKSGS